MATMDMAAGYLDYKHSLIGDGFWLSAFARAEAGVFGLQDRPINPYLAAMAGLRLDW